MNYEMSINQFKALISQPQFALKQYEWVDYKEFEQLSNYGRLGNLFEELADKFGRVPTQDEYVAEGIKISEQFFKYRKNPYKDERWLKVGTYPSGKPIWHNFVWDEKLQKAIKHRLARSYPSHLTEYSTILMLKSQFPQYMVGASDHLDNIMGVDIVIGSQEDNKVAYVHVTSASDYSDHWLKVKESRTGKSWDKQGNKHEYKRNFKKGHIHLAFSKNGESESTEVINGIPMFKESHIQQVLDVFFMFAPHTDTWENQEQLTQLNTWLINNGVDTNGLGYIWI